MAQINNPVMMILATGRSIKLSAQSQHRIPSSSSPSIIEAGTSRIREPISPTPATAHRFLIPVTSMQQGFMRHGLRIRGFTLIEIMVVLLIIGVILGVAIPALNIDSDEDRLNKETLRLSALIDLASQESILNAKVIGIRAAELQYQFFFLDQDKWKSLEDKILSKHELPEDIELELILEEFNTAETFNSDIDEQQTIPQIMILPSGEFTPFTINFKSRNTETYFSLNGHANGKLEIIKHNTNQ